MKFLRLFENFDTPALDVQWATGTFEGKLKMTVWKLRENTYAQVTLDKHGDVWKIADKRDAPVQVWYGSREEGTGVPKDMSVDLGHHINDLLESDLEKQLGKDGTDKHTVNVVPQAPPTAAEKLDDPKIPLMRGQKR